MPPRISRYYWLAAAFLHVGIFAFSGIFFWKWIVTDVAIYWFLSRSGLEIHKQIWSHKLGLLFGVALLWFSLDRVYFWPQTGVAWYDSRVLEHYSFIGVDRDGEKHRIDPLSITPFDTRFIQGDFGYVTREKTLSRTMGTTGDYRLMTELNHVKDGSEFPAIQKPPLCQRGVRQAALEISVPMGGEWTRNRAQTYTRFWPGRLSCHERTETPRREWRCVGERWSQRTPHVLGS